MFSSIRAPGVRRGRESVAHWRSWQPCSTAACWCLKATSPGSAALPPSAIVNAANSSLLGGGGVDGAIHRRGGKQILDECKEIRRSRHPDGLPTGEAVITGAGRLAVDYVVHTVGPVWNGGGSGEPELLRSAYRNSMLLAAQHGVREMAFPAISTGVYGYPPALAAREALAAVEHALAGRPLPERVHLLFFSAADQATFLDAIRTA